VKDVKKRRYLAIEENNGVSRNTIKGPGSGSFNTFLKLEI